MVGSNQPLTPAARAFAACQPPKQFVTQNTGALALSLIKFSFICMTCALSLQCYV